MTRAPVTTWMEIVVTGLDDAWRDEFAAILCEQVQQASAGLEIRDHEIAFWVDVEDAARAQEGTQEVLARYQARAEALESAVVETRTAAPESAWRDAWKRYFHTLRLTRQLVVVPSWDRYESLADPAEDDLVIALDPGQAFGTGAHASTTLVLDRLQQLADAGFEPTRCLDVGCGSGILAIFCALRWPRAQVIAVDTDPLACDASRQNSTDNRVDHVEVRQGTADDVEGPFDLIVANIQASVLEAARDALASRCVPDGRVVLSGLLTEQVDAVARHYQSARMAIVERVTSTLDPEWTCLMLTRGPS